MELLQILTMVLVVVWTVRLARSKGRHPWMWGGAALMLSLIPSSFSLMGMAPIVILLFLKRSQASSDSGTGRSDCPRCRKHFTHGQRYCVNCGWDLSKSYVGEPAPNEETVSAPASAGTVEISVGTGDPPPGEPVEPVEPATEAISQAGDNPVVEEVETQPAPDRAPSETEIRTGRGVPTAASMTDRGTNLFDQGRVQESIDQFTKAIALDPSYKNAWEQRAEAYARLGRGQEADEDRRRLRALNATPSAG